MNLVKIKELIDIIREKTIDIRCDWDDPRSRCQAIIDACEELYVELGIKEVASVLTIHLKC